MSLPMPPRISMWFAENGDFPENLVDPTVDEPVCVACGVLNPTRTKNSVGTLMCEDCIDDFEALLPDEIDPCCYNSFRNFGTGDHEFGCPNY